MCASTLKSRWPATEPFSQWRAPSGTEHLYAPCLHRSIRAPTAAGPSSALLPPQWPDSCPLRNQAWASASSPDAWPLPPHRLSRSSRPSLPLRPARWRLVALGHVGPDVQSRVGRLEGAGWARDGSRETEGSGKRTRAVKRSRRTAACEGRAAVAGDRMSMPCWVTWWLGSCRLGRCAGRMKEARKKRREDDAGELSIIRIDRSIKSSVLVPVVDHFDCIRMDLVAPTIAMHPPLSSLPDEPLLRPPEFGRSSSSSHRPHRPMQLGSLAPNPGRPAAEPPS